MPLPTSRNRTYVEGAPVIPGDLNDLQDQIIGAKRRPFTRTFLPKFSTLSNFVAGSNPDTHGTPGLVVFNSPGGAVSNATFDIPFDDGDRLLNLSYWAIGNGTTDLTSATLLYAATMPELGTNLMTWVDNNRAATWGLVDVSAVSISGPIVDGGKVLAAGAWLGVKLTTNAAGYSIGPCIAKFDRL